MEFRSQKTNLGLIVLCLAAPLWAGSAREFPARHAHWRRGCAGILRFDDSGVGFEQKGGDKTPHRFHWNWQDIQQLELSDGKLVRVVSYHDRVALAGQDQPFTFLLDGRVDLTPVYRELREKLDQRLVARLADAAGAPLWTLAVKRLGAVRGSEGTLLVLAEGIVYKTETPWQSRTWRDSDIDNISTSGPFELSVTTLERNGVFHFQLKQTLHRERYEALWHRLNRPKGLALISTTKENTQ